MSVMLSEGAERRRRNISAESLRPAEGTRPRSLDRLGMTATVFRTLNPEP